MTFAVAIPAQSVAVPRPGLSGTTLNRTGDVPGTEGLQPDFLINHLGCTKREVAVSWQTINNSGWYVYTFMFAGTAISDHRWIAGEEQQIFSIRFKGCPEGTDLTSWLLMNLPDGGTQNNAYWYFQCNTLGDITNYEAPFYATPQSATPGAGLNKGSALVTIGLIKTPDAIKNDVQHFAVYPTLTKGPINLMLPSGFANTKVKVTNAAGQSVLTSQVKGSSGQLNLKDLPGGVYLIQISNNAKASESIKVVLQK